MLPKIVSSVRTFAKLIPKSHLFKITPVLPICRSVHCFSSQQKPGPEDLQEVKRQGQEFYETQLSSVVDLKRIQDFEPIVKTSEVPILVSFYAEWNMACKTMAPKLESRVKGSKGQVKMLTINIDKFGPLVQAFQVKAVPTVFLVYKDKGFDQFTGEISDDMLDKFFQSISRVHSLQKGETETIKVLEEAQVALRNSDFEKAEKILSGMKLSQTTPQYGLVRNIFLAYAYGELGKITQLKSLVEVMSKNEEFYVSKPEFNGLYFNLVDRCQQLEQAKQENSELAQWKAKLQEHPNDLQVKFDAAAFFAQNELLEEALQELLAIVKANKEWQGKKANKAILDIFKQLGNASPITQNYRKLLQRALH